MTRAELVAELAASNLHLRQEDAEWVVLSRDHRRAGAGPRVELRGFGAFSVKQRNARLGRNPRTGRQVPVDAKPTPYFRISKELHKWLNRRP